jgi:hypothetical protein
VFMLARCTASVLSAPAMLAGGGLGLPATYMYTLPPLKPNLRARAVGVAWRCGAGATQMQRLRWAGK